MKLTDEMKLVVLTYLIEKGARPITDIQAELEIPEDEDFQPEGILNDLFFEGCIMLISSDTTPETNEISKWEITESGRIRLKDLALDKYEEDIRMPHIIRAIVLVVAILAFMMIFPRMFRRF
jgi:hypothetical protein